jgi:tRNA/tmRNA/rRNA uracil-C5-methylase (TrmA/RlmC/RlmD family)
MKTCPHWNPLASKCGGCFDRNLNFSRLSQIKEKAVLKTFEQNFDYQPDQASLIIPENTEIREKLDFLIEGNSIGLKSQTPPYSVIDITSCDVIEKTLFETFLSLRPYLKNLVERGSFRLRLGLDKTPYLWMDVSHADTQRLFKQKKTLMPLFELCEIEWGQRKKPLILDSSGEFKLLKKYSTLPSLFQTSVLNEPFNLKMHVSDFSQPNTQLNFQIIELITQILKNKPKPILAEFGSGIGNFTFAMAPYCQHIVCFEWDQFACEA